MVRFLAFILFSAACSTQVGASVVQLKPGAMPALPGQTVSLSQFYDIIPGNSTTAFGGMLSVSVCCKSGSGWTTVGSVDAPAGGGQIWQGWYGPDALSNARFTIDQNYTGGSIYVPGGGYQYYREYMGNPQGWIQFVSGGWTIPISSGVTFEFLPSTNKGSFEVLGRVIGGDLSDAANLIGADHFNWQNVILSATAEDPMTGDRFHVTDLESCEKADLSFFGGGCESFVKDGVFTLSAPMNDPPPGGWPYLPADKLPFYWNEDFVGPLDGYHWSENVIGSDSFVFKDQPSFALVGGELEFITRPVGVLFGAEIDLPKDVVSIFHWKFSHLTGETIRLARLPDGSDGYGSVELVGAYSLANAPDFILKAIGKSAAIPEPSTWALMIMGFGLAGLRFRFRGQSASVTIGQESWGEPSLGG